MTRRITRREFIKVGVGAGAAAAALTGCQMPRRWVTLEPYVRPPEEQLAGVATWYASTCRQCPAGCGVIVRIMNGRALKIEGNPLHPLNKGKLCARGQSGLQVLYNPDRLQGPARQGQRGSLDFSAITWVEALNILFEKIQAAGGGLAVWGGSSMSVHLYELFARLSKQAGAQDPLIYDLYTALNGDYLVSQSSQTVYGARGLPSYDLSQADVVLSFGADFAGVWQSAVRYGIDFGAFRSQELGKRGYLVQLEPRMTNSGAKADRWLPLQPGSEGLVAQALLSIIASQNLGGQERAGRAQSLAQPVDLNAVLGASGIPFDELHTLARLFAQAERPLAIPGGALTGTGDAAGALAAIHALNLVAGNGNAPGGVYLPASPLSPALASPSPSSLAAVRDLIGRMGRGEVQALLLHGANPLYDLPPRLGLQEALQKVPFIVSFNPLVDETSRWADLLLPDHTYLEGWGYALPAPDFGMPTISSQQPVVTPYYDTRATADLLLAMGAGLSKEAFPWADEVAFLKDTLGKRLSSAGGGELELAWSRFQQHGGWWPASPPALSAPAPPLQKPVQVSAPAFQGDAATYPFFLHLYMPVLLSDGRGANQPWLQGSPDPMTSLSWQTWVEIHPQTADQLGLQDGDLVKVTSPQGEIEAAVYRYPAIRPDTLALPLGQGHTEYGRYARQMGSNPMALVGDQADQSGDGLAWANLRVKITPTGKRIDLASFENRAGVTQGFINQAFPGQ